MSKRIVLATLNAITLIITIVVNYLANALPINGQTTVSVWDKFDVLFKPAAYVFSIWGLVYLGLFAFVIFQFLPSQRGSKIVDKIGIYFIVSNLANSLWILNWHYEKFLFTVLLMIVILYSLVRIYLKLQVSLEIVELGKKLFVHAPISLYTGWILIVLIANMNIYLESINWTGWGISNVVWFSVSLFIGLGLLLYIIITRTDMVVGVVYLWAYWGIAEQNTFIPKVSTISWIAVGIVLLIFLFGIFKKIQLLISTYQNES